MPSIMISLKDGADASELEQAKKQVTDQGGKITNEFQIVPGFSADIPDDVVTTLKSNDKLNVEADSTVTTQ